MTAVAIIVVGGGLAHVAPKFGGFYADLYGEGFVPPVLTQISLARAPFGWTALGVIGAVLVVGKDMAYPSRRLPNWPFIMALGVVSAMATISLFLPLLITFTTISPTR